MQRPTRLYKYEQFSTQSLLNLKKQVIYFGSPLNFNDPYDCALRPEIATPNPGEVVRIRDQLLSLEATPAALRAQLATTSVDELRATVLRAARAGFDSVVQSFLATRGVACFSERNDDLLMWSHYGGNYKGICLEFDTSAEAFKRVQPVRYVRTPPVISVESFLFDSSYSPIRELFCIKSTAWEYEAEWRGIHVKAGTEFDYPSSTLTGVYFGPDIDVDSLEIVCLILAGQNDSVRLWRGSRSTAEFKVEFEQFTFASHLEAAGLGPRARPYVA